MESNTFTDPRTGASITHSSNAGPMIDIEIVAKQQGLAKKMASYVDPYSNPFVSAMAVPRSPVNPNIIVEEMSVDKLDNGLLMRIKVNPGGPYRRIYVESIDKLGDALVKALVEARIEL